ncbi:manganese efflux pump MntP [Pseudogracilibacillus auburnensis]|uniref:manganese efflux pump MntP n=1 Tax=Pseudogracilibacillus auburnensis TaxID=1494959 RepID=UPI001A96044C|nr:manganese efflux pump [Pseudogracilibacillus auburnensis]MBO1004801.1 manganese efflux pump [Pseudogracilibacillus auburnensis]
MLLPELVTLLIMAFAVAMDAFSVSLGLGLYKFRLRRIFYIGITVGIFHIMMPLLGIFTGHLLSDTFGKITNYIGGILLIILGVQMIISCFSDDDRALIAPMGFVSLMLFSLLISLDSFSAGLSLGMYGVRAAIAVICFGIVASVLTWSGLLLGRRAHYFIGTYSEVLGGSILVAFGIKLLIL